MELLKEVKINSVPQVPGAGTSGNCWLQLYQKDAMTALYHILLINKTNDHDIKIYSTAKWDEAKAEFDYLLTMFDIN